MRDFIRCVHSVRSVNFDMLYKFSLNLNSYVVLRGLSLCLVIVSSVLSEG